MQCTGEARLVSARLPIAGVTANICTHLVHKMTIIERIYLHISFFIAPSNIIFGTSGQISVRIGWGGRGRRVRGVNYLLADLLGEAELYSGAGGGSELGDAYLRLIHPLLYIWDSDTTLRDYILTTDDGEADLLFDASS